MPDSLTPRTITAPDWNYSCIDCGQCCRRWHVELSRIEETSLNAFEWKAEDEIPSKRTVRISGSTFIAHRDDDTCIYYNRAENKCLIHQRFGYKAKPLGCKVYPFNIAPTFESNCSLICRFDCPAVRQRKGKALDKQLSAARGFVPELQLGAGFDKLDLEGLQPAKAQAIVKAIIKHGFSLNVNAVDMMIILQKAAHRFEALGVDFINDIDMNEIFPSFFERLVNDRQQEKLRRLGAMEQVRFLSLLSAFLRRDEEVVGKGLAARLGRAAAFVRLYTSNANLHDLGEEHPDVALGRKTFYGTPVSNLDELDLSLMFDLIRVRLESYQFFGAYVYNRSFFFGMQTLFLMMPLIFGLAKWNALARSTEVCEISADDVDYAVGAIDHAYGRSSLIGMRFMSSLQRQCSDPGAFSRIVDELANPKEQAG